MRWRRGYRCYDDAYKAQLRWLGSWRGQLAERFGWVREPRWCWCGHWHLDLLRLLVRRGRSR
ncbi:hypothetical protein LX83_001405 [Goodfellowiella coeruleoviolacea]|uniref:Uncharacterized protein n=1 Tax=Goodfellowiella coeruleoviolacea TaxID=334858 RepID=A0AAE3GBW2_9PSEU|nr:hypothetical protein [Goodfellowiella coeruleoviolacea]